MVSKITSDDLKTLTQTLTLTATHTDSSQELLITLVVSIPTMADFVHFITPVTTTKK